MISKDKTYTTRDGREVRIYATDGGGTHPVHGAVRNAGGIDGWIAFTWAAGGEYRYNHDVDLIEAPVTRQMWANVYKTSHLDCLHPSREAADKYCCDCRIACVPVTIAYRPREGL